MRAILELPLQRDKNRLCKQALKCYYDEKLFSSFSLDSDFIFGKNAPCQLLRFNFINKSDFFNYDFSFKLSAAITDTVLVELH